MNQPPYRYRVARGRRCANCDAGLLWGRWCIDCVRMAGKAIGTVVLAEGAHRIAVWLLVRLWP